jgi:hypothetical protein
MVKRLINVEKKFANTSYDLVSGQVNGLGGGANIFDVTPSFIGKGSDRNQRTGNSIKLTGIHFEGQFQHQSITSDSNVVIIELWKPRATAGVPMSLSSTGEELFNTNPFINQIDFQSRRNSDYYHDYYRLRYLVVKIPGDLTNVNINRTINFRMGVKLNHHLRWKDDNTLIGGQIFMTIRCASGNSSGTTNATDPDLSHTATNTGLKTRIAQISYYVDN